VYVAYSVDYCHFMLVCCVFVLDELVFIYSVRPSDYSFIYYMSLQFLCFRPLLQERLVFVSNVPFFMYF